MTMIKRDPVIANFKPELWSPGFRFDHPLANGCVLVIPFWDGGIGNIGNKPDNMPLLGMSSPSLEVLSGAALDNTFWRNDEEGRNFRFPGTHTNHQFTLKPDNKLASFFTTEATIIMRLKIDVNTPLASEQTGIIDFQTYGSASHYPFTDGNLYFATFCSATRPISGVDNSGFDKSQWHQLVISVSPGANNYRVYQNGHLTTTATGEASVSLPADIRLGRSVSNRLFQGNVAFFGIWNRQLTQTEIEENYHNPYALITPKKTIILAAAAVPQSLAVIKREPVIANVKPKLWSPGFRQDHPISQGCIGLWPCWENGGTVVHDVAGYNYSGAYNHARAAGTATPDTLWNTFSPADGAGSIPQHNPTGPSSWIRYNQDDRLTLDKTITLTGRFSMFLRMFTHRGFNNFFIPIGDRVNSFWAQRTTGEFRLYMEGTSVDAPIAYPWHVKHWQTWLITYDNAKVSFWANNQSKGSTASAGRTLALLVVVLQQHIKPPWLLILSQFGIEF